MPNDVDSQAAAAALPPDRLYTRCDPDLFDFETTAEVAGAEIIVGQDRALSALDFGVRMRSHGYNLFVLGRAGSGRHHIVEEFLQRLPTNNEKPLVDWCYLNNFEDERKPVALSLPAGYGARLRAETAQLIEDLRGAIPAMFESEQHGSALAEINQDFEDRLRASLETLQERAKEQDLSLVPTPHGFAIAPTRDGKLLSDEEFEQLPEDDKKRKTDAMEAISEEIRKHFEQLPRWQKEHRDRIKELQRQLIGLAVDQLIAQIKARYSEFQVLIDHFEKLREDVIQNARLFQPQQPAGPGQPEFSAEAALSRYEVNLLVDHSGDERAPVVYESNPSIANLLGRIEHIAQFGALITNFTMILPGALHKANGGYLILDAHRVLMEPMAWSALKRALADRQIRIESIGQLMSLVSTVSLEPDAIPADIKVVLIGERWVYYLLSSRDSEFNELFKVAADFEDRIDRSVENVREYAQYLAGFARSENLLPLTRHAVARTIEHSARMQGDAEKLTTRLRDVSNLVCEANFWAQQENATAIDAMHIEKSIDAQIARLDRLRSEIQEEIRRDTVLIDTDGSAVAQVNGLAVLEISGFRFGKPSRITSSIRIGDGTIVDIERESALGGPIHSKGVLILSSYLRSRYATDVPLSISASLVFEQSYGGVEGDSASIAETCALLSAIAEVPIRQSLAVTGSINQHGVAQVIGGVNEKIEGFFDICKARGLTGSQGVLIPRDNVQHLMLREDVVAAVRQGQFNVYPVASVDEAIALLTGMPAGARDATGKFPRDSINGRVERLLRKHAETRRQFSRTGAGRSRPWARNRVIRRPDEQG